MDNELKCSRTLAAESLLLLDGDWTIAEELGMSVRGFP